jgi:hypothetical protein
MNLATFKESSMTTDFTFLPSDFSATEITLVANTKIAKEYLAKWYGLGCVAINVRKSAAPSFADNLEFEGLTYA